MFSIASLFLYFRRRSRVILLTSLLSIVLSLVGVIGTIKIQSLMMFLHSFLCTTIFGAFYVFLILEILFSKKPQETG